MQMIIIKKIMKVDEDDNDDDIITDNICRHNKHNNI